MGKGLPPDSLQQEMRLKSHGLGGFASLGLQVEPGGLGGLLGGGGGGGGVPGMSPDARMRGPSTPLHAVRDSLRSGGGARAGLTSQQGETRELVNSMRQRIVSNFQERMQLRRSLIELEDQNVQNSIEVSKRQLLVVQWTEQSHTAAPLESADFSAHLLAHAPTDIVGAWRECEQLRKAVLKNNSVKRSIAKRLRHNEREAERFRDELGDKITGEDRRELMELQYQVGRLELENMELEQHRIVHESILKGKDLTIQKLMLQLAVRDKLIARQQAVLRENGLEDEVGYSQLALMEKLGGDTRGDHMAPPSPPRHLSGLVSGGGMALIAGTIGGAGAGQAGQGMTAGHGGAHGGAHGAGQGHAGGRGARGGSYSDRQGHANLQGSPVQLRGKVIAQGSGSSQNHQNHAQYHSSHQGMSFHVNFSMPVNGRIYRNDKS